MIWSQVYDPLSSMWLSTLLAALPVLVLLGAAGTFEMRMHLAALNDQAHVFLHQIFNRSINRPLSICASYIKDMHYQIPTIIL